MKILKHGDLKQYKFECNTCGCEFAASIGEYEKFWNNRIEYFGTHCPECSNFVYQKVVDAQSVYVKMED